MIILMLLACLPLIGQSFDFNGGLGKWTATGSAFDGQPVRASGILSDRLAPVTVGGDYWRGMPFPLGQRNEFLIATAALHGEGATGTLTSGPFELSPEFPYFSFLLGGTRDPSGIRVELQVHARKDGDGGYLTAISATGPGYESLRQEVFRVPEHLFGRTARVKIIDESPAGHINIDAIRFTSARPDAHPTSVWGYADYHTHPMNYLSFGGLEGMRIIWGSPGGNYDDYVRDPTLIERDLPRCIRGHGGGPLANPFLNAAQILQYRATPNLLLFSHGQRGAPSFHDFPSFKAGTHQQMHITQIRRNYEGGLRLMAGLATDNSGAEYLTSHVENGNHVGLVSERKSVEAQLAGMVEQARLNSSWMQIAYSPEDAREIVLHNKLAVVLAVEVDRLGTYGLAPDQDHEAEYEADYLWGLGVRAVTPIHAADNLLGGAAVSFAPYNWLNDLLHRKKLDMTEDELDLDPARYFEVDTWKCDGPVGECVQLHLKESQQNRLYIGRCLESFGRLSPCLKQNEPWAPYHPEGGHRNKREFTRFGRQYIEALMDRGMIVDTAHMSDKSVEGVYSAIGGRLARDHPECSGDLNSNTAECNEFAYPAIVSHAHFRAQARYGARDFMPSEYDIGNHNLKLMRRVGGVAGAFVAEDRIAGGNTLAFKNDCALSSKSFGYSLDFAQRALGRYGAGMATDFTLIPGAAPRFGPDACWAYHMAEDPGQEKKTGYYDFDAQDKGVLYRGMAVKRGVKAGPNAPLIYYQMGKRKFDFNVDGLAHFGMVPDLLQDLKNLGAKLDPLFSSAEGYIRMWEKAERASRYHRRRDTPR